MDYESAGAGAGSGLIIAVLTFVGFRSRLDRLEKAVVYQDTCNKCESKSDSKIIALQDLHRDMKEEQRSINEKLDKILFHLVKADK